MKTPNLSPRTMNLDLNYTNKLLGMNFSKKDVKKLLERMRYGVRLKKEEIQVLIPAYRADILHQIDLVEDIAISYGYGNFKPELPKIATTGKKDSFEKFSGNIRELMLGFGFHEVMTLVMTNKNDLFIRMNMPEESVAETENPVSEEHTVGRNRLLPSLMAFLEKNRDRGYPQKIFEIGDCILSDGNNIRKFSGVIAHSKTNFSEIKAIVAGIFEDIGLKYKIEKFNHNSFINGRYAMWLSPLGSDICQRRRDRAKLGRVSERLRLSATSLCHKTEFGFFGEIHPQVLENFGLEVPVTGFELDLNLVFKNVRIKGKVPP